MSLARHGSSFTPVMNKPPPSPRLRCPLLYSDRYTKVAEVTVKPNPKKSSSVPVAVAAEGEKVGHVSEVLLLVVAGATHVQVHVVSMLPWTQ